MADMFKMVDAAGAESVPFDGEALIAYARQGIIQPATMIYDVTVGRWMPAGQHPLLGGGAPSTPPPSGTPPPASLGNYVPYTPNPQAARSSAWPKVVAVVLLLSVIGFVGLGLFLANKYGGSTAPAMQTVATHDGKYAISLPDSWIPWKTDDKEMIQYIDATTGDSVTMVSVSDDGVDSTQLPMLMDNVVQLEAKNTHDTPIGKPQSVKIGGFPGYQQDIKDSSGSDDLNYRITLVGVPDAAYMIVTFVKKPTDAAGLDSVVSTFHKVSAPAKAPAAKAKS